MFSGEKPEVNHLKIFGFSVFVHVPKEKRTKLDPFGKHGIFVCYSDTSKAYMIYIHGHQKVEISQDVTFDESATFSKSKQGCAKEVHEEENEVTRVLEAETVELKEVIHEDNDMEEPQRPTEMPSRKRKPTWEHELIRDAERYGALGKHLRESKKLKPYSSYVACLCDIMDAELSSYEEAAKKRVWKDAMGEEYQSILKNGVWDVVPRPKEKSVVSSKWIYKTKHAVDGSIEKYKARFVARGFSQKEGIDYEETFSLLARYTSIRTILSLAVVMKWKVHKMDVKTTFLNGEIKEEVYVEQPQGFEVHDRETHVCRLKKALYGLKQAPRAWYGRIDNFLMSLGFTKSSADPNLYFKVVDDGLVILLLYVDDLFLTGVEKLISECKRKLVVEFEMKYLKMMHYFLGLEVWQRQDEIFLNQGKYAMEILKRFGCWIARQWLHLWYQI
jgi:hypothetical protein